MPLTAIVAATLLLTSAQADQGGSQARPTNPYEAIIDRFSMMGKFNGLVLIQQGPRRIFATARGIADFETNRKLTLDTAVHISNITMQMTAALVLQLVGEGRIGLDEPIATYLPWFTRKMAERITIRFLLTHSAGLNNMDTALPKNSDGIGGIYLQRDPSLFTPRAMVEKYGMGSLSFEVGNTFKENNMDFIVLGAVLEAVSGKPYSELLKSRILKPLKMKNTSYVTTESLPPAAAKSSIAVGKNFMALPQLVAANLGPAGAVVSTLEDLLRWSEGLQSGTVIPKSAFAMMIKPDFKFGYTAFGCASYPVEAGGRLFNVVDRRGSFYASQSSLLMIPVEKLTIIVLATTDTSDLGSVYTRRGIVFNLLEAWASTTTSIAKKSP